MPHKMTSTSSSPITLVSVVIPVYNEEESLPELLHRAPPVPSCLRHTRLSSLMMAAGMPRPS